MTQDAAHVFPFARNSLQPVISARTVDFHFGRHQLGYLKKLDSLTQGTVFERHPLEDIIRETRLSCENCAIFNNAAQAWNHAVFWHSLAPYGRGGTPGADLMQEIERSFGSFGSFKALLLATAAKRFGSGWLWLVKANGRLSVYTTPNAETPVSYLEIKPLLTIDLWEHAYYLDWQDQRGAFVEAVFDHLVNWPAVTTRFSSNDPV